MSEEGTEGLAYLLDRDVRAIGPERAAAPPAPHVMLLISPYGSYRYVGFEERDGERVPVSALQIMSRDGRSGTIANVYTAPSARRRGWAKRLLEAARKRFRDIAHSDDLSAAGAAWKKAVRDPTDAEDRAQVIADAILEGRDIDWSTLSEADMKALLVIRDGFLDRKSYAEAEALTRALSPFRRISAAAPLVYRRIARERAIANGTYPTLWHSRTYPSPHSTVVDGSLHVEGRTRQEALGVLHALAESPRSSAARGHARRAVLDDNVRHSLVRAHGEHAYAAADGTWRGGGLESWEVIPPRAYGRWD